MGGTVLQRTDGTLRPTRYAYGEVRSAVERDGGELVRHQNGTARHRLSGPRMRHRGGFQYLSRSGNVRSAGSVRRAGDSDLGMTPAHRARWHRVRHGWGTRADADVHQEAVTRPRP